MARRPTRRDLSTGILIVLLAGVLVAQTMGAGATHMPADKAAANGNKIVVVPAVPVPDSPTGTEILRAKMKTSKPQDLVFNVNLECSIITNVYTQGGATPGPNNAKRSSTQEAEGRLRVWV